MKNNLTQGASGGEGFEPIESESIQDLSTSKASFGALGSDTWGIRHWPTFFQYLENRFAFSAALLSVAGYVIIAAAGQFDTLGKYVGYLLFLALILTSYNFYEKGISKDKKSLILISLAALLFAIVLYQNWKYMQNFYQNLKPYFVIQKQSSGK